MILKEIMRVALSRVVKIGRLYFYSKAGMPTNINSLFRGLASNTFCKINWMEGQLLLNKRITNIL